jgi:tetratricopeptide (TPR) repeat protein
MNTFKKILTVSVLVGLFIIPFIAFIVPNGMYFPFITGKGFVFRILVEIIFGLYVILAAVEPAYRPKCSWLSRSVGVFALATLTADIFSVYPYKSLWSNYERMEGFVLIAHLALLFFVMIGMFRKKSDWHNFFNTSIFASLIMSGYGTLQLLGKIAINQGGVRLDATFGNATYLAIYLVFHIFLCLYMLIQPSKMWRKWVYGIVAVYEVYILYFTATRGAILGLLGGLILAAILVAWKEKENKIWRKTAGGMLVGIAVIVLGFLAVRNTSFVQHSPVLSRFANLSFSEIETQGRYYVWPMAVKGFMERPILGWGQESFNYVFNKFYDPRMWTQEQWFDRTHDIVLDWLSNGGLIGFLAYASMYVTLIYYVFRKKSLLSLYEKSLIFGLIAAYIFNNLFVFDNLISYIMFFSVLAFVHTVAIAPEEGKQLLVGRKISNDVILYAITPAVLVVLAAAVYFVNVPAIRANTTLIQAMSPQTSGGPEQNLALFQKALSYNSFGSSEVLEQLIQISVQVTSSNQVSASTKENFYKVTKEAIEKKIASTPNDSRYLLFAGEFFNQYGQYDQALSYLERALKNSPNKQTIYFEAGTSYLGKGDYANAELQFKKAYDLAPSYPDAAIIYAVGAIYSKDNETLKVLLPQIGEEKMTNDNRILSAYANSGNYGVVIEILNSRLAKDPTNQQYQLSLASVYVTMGQKQKAIAILKQMIVQNPSFKSQGEMYIQQVENAK